MEQWLHRSITGCDLSFIHHPIPVLKVQLWEYWNHPNGSNPGDTHSRWCLFHFVSLYKTYSNTPVTHWERIVRIASSWTVPLTTGRFYLLLETISLKRQIQLFITSFTFPSFVNEIQCEQELWLVRTRQWPLWPANDLIGRPNWCCQTAVNPPSPSFSPIMFKRRKTPVWTSLMCLLLFLPRTHTQRLKPSKKGIAFRILPSTFILLSALMKEERKREREREKHFENLNRCFILTTHQAGTVRQSIFHSLKQAPFIHS